MSPEEILIHCFRLLLNNQGKEFVGSQGKRDEQGLVFVR